MDELLADLALLKLSVWSKSVNYNVVLCEKVEDKVQVSCVCVCVGGGGGGGGGTRS